MTSANETGYQYLSILVIPTDSGLKGGSRGGALGARAPPSVTKKTVLVKKHKNCIKLDLYLPHHLQIYHTTALTLLKACIIHCQPTTLLCSCNGVFTSKVIIRLNFPLIRLPQEPDDQLHEIKLTS